MTWINNGDITGTLYLDFRKVLNFVDHSVLLKKLPTYIFFFTFIASYRQGRQQVMDNGKGISRPANIKS